MDERIVARFWAKVDRSGECWFWTGSTTEGYGVLRIAGRNVLAHRLSYELHVASIPEGLTIDHLCRVRHCVNPAHIEPITRGENVLRGEGITARQARQTHCKRGHPLSGENLLLGTDGHRRCRTCRATRDHTRKRWAK